VHVLIVGVSTRAAADSAARAGYEITSLDAYADLDQHPSVRALSLPKDFGAPFSPDAVVNAARDLPSDALMYLSSFENHPRAVQALAGERALWGNTPDVLRRVRDPQMLARALSLRGIRAPLVTTETPPPGEERWVIKPRVSGGGHGVRVWHPGDTLRRGQYLQQFVAGVPGSVIFVAAGGRGVALGTSRQLVGDSAFGVSGYRYCGNIMSASVDALKKASALVDAVSEEFPLVGVGCIDFITSDGELYPVEVNPRWSASMELIERARRLSMFTIHADACVRGVLPHAELFRTPLSLTYGKAVVFARKEVVAGDTLAWLDDDTVRDIPRAGDRIGAGEPICTVFAVGSDDASCHAALVARAERVYSEVAGWAG
jgi:predicted ATP-grasp superfamily ATP-dependent carboligase